MASVSEELTAFQAHATSERGIGALLLVYGLGSAWMYGSHLLAAPNFHAFLALFAFTMLMRPPRIAVSPLTIFYAYYGVWFVIAPLFAEIYQRDTLHRPEYTLSLALAYSVFGIGVVAIEAGTRLAQRWKLRAPGGEPAPSYRLRRWVFLLYVTSTIFVAMIVSSSGGLERWISDPGDAFLNRGGSGVYVILSHFSSLALAALSGYWSYRSRTRWPLFVFLFWVVVTSPVHGSKGQIALLVILAVLPWLRTMRFVSLRSSALYIAFGAIFFLGVIFRNVSWIDATTIVPYALNYFTALENLAISVRDFEPQFMRTFFLPFVKFSTPFGLQDSSMYFDMNHMLTDIYYPHAWEIRATEQWPVETDLYLNFYFVFGLPLVAGYLMTLGAIAGYAVRRNTLGPWFAAAVLTVFMLSHLRGSLINHTDFYMYPYIFFMYYVLRNLPLARANGPGAAARQGVVRPGHG
jgi:hypothetical protein